MGKQRNGKKGEDIEMRRIFYGLADSGELVTEALSNPEFAAVLGNLRGISRKTGTLKHQRGSILDQLVKNVVKLIKNIIHHYALLFWIANAAINTSSHQHRVMPLRIQIQYCV